MSCSLRDGKGVRITRQGSPRELVAYLEGERLGFPRRELQRGVGAEMRGRPPGLHVPSHGKHLQVSVEEDEVDRKAHERGMHEPCWPDQHAAATGQPRASDQASQPADEAVGDLAPFADDLTFRSYENKRAHKGRQYRGATSKPPLPDG
jgi:hypothetical protein